jgi:GTP-binding protein
VTSRKPPARPAGDSPRAAQDDALDPWEIVHADFVAAAGPDSKLPDHGPEVAFAGRSNVGKSSLINALTGRKNLVRTGATPGVTRTLTQFTARTRAGQTFAIVDLPGYGFAQRSKAERQQWASLIEAYLRERRQLFALVLLVDARRGMEEDDHALVDFVSSSHGEGGRPAPQVIVCATKIDKVGRSEQFKLVSSLGTLVGARTIAVSSVTGQGKSDLGRRLALALERAGARR